MIIKVVIDNDYKLINETLPSYCNIVAKKNNAILYLLEEYLGKKLTDDEILSDIRNIILDTSADIQRLPNFIVIEGDNNEKL